MSGEAYEDHLPEPEDAFAHTMRQWEENDLDDPVVGMHVTSLEAPANRLVHELLCAEAGIDDSLEVSYGEIQSPDPRKPRGKVKWQLWRYEDTTPVKLFEPPPAAVTHGIARVAAEPYSLRRWMKEGERLGRSLGPARAGEVLAVMVHPPPPPDERSAVTWVQEIQFAAAFTIAGLDEGWFGSRRHEVLLDLARGPMDWSVTAAIVTLAHIARNEPAAREQVGVLFAALWNNIPRPGYCPWDYALACVWQWLPDLDASLREELERYVEEHDDSIEE
jgi:hypothetical protein